jgi:hypothetical protein
MVQTYKRLFIFFFKKETKPFYKCPFCKQKSKYGFPFLFMFFFLKRTKQKRKAKKLFLVTEDTHQAIQAFFNK